MVPCYDYYAAVVFQAEPSNVSTTIINGKIVMENREMKTIDIREDRETMNRIKQDITPFARELEIKSNAARNEAVDHKVGNIRVIPGKQASRLFP